MRSSGEWLLLDVGNTHTVAGVVAGSKRVETARYRTDPAATADEYRSLLRDLLPETCGALPSRRPAFAKTVVSSVVPQLDATIQEALAPTPVHFLNHQSPCDFTLGLPVPAQLGADRLANLAGSLQYIQAPASGNLAVPLLIIDAGTATTFCLLDRARVYRGGAIVPGLEIGWQALQKRAAKLSAVDLVRPESPIGTTTDTQIQSGVLVSYEAMIEAFSQKLLAAWKSPETRILTTGGCMHRLRLPPHFEQVPDLTLIGLERYGQLLE